MKYFSFAMFEILAVMVWSTTHAWAIFLAVMGFVMLWAMRMPWEGIKPVNGTRNGAEPKGIIKANGKAFEAWPPPPGVYAEFCEQIREKLEGK